MKYKVLKIVPGTHTHTNQIMVTTVTTTTAGNTIIIVLTRVDSDRVCRY